MSMHWRKVVWALASTVVWTGCGTGPPGAGITNGEPAAIGDREKPAQRNDLPTPDLSTGDEPLADAAAAKPATSDSGATPGSPGGGGKGTPTTSSGSQGAEGSAKPADGRSAEGSPSPR